MLKNKKEKFEINDISKERAMSQMFDTFKYLLWRVWCAIPID